MSFQTAPAPAGAPSIPPGQTTPVPTIVTALPEKRDPQIFLDARSATQDTGARPLDARGYNAVILDFIPIQGASACSFTLVGSPTGGAPWVQELDPQSFQSGLTVPTRVIVTNISAWLALQSTAPAGWAVYATLFDASGTTNVNVTGTEDVNLAKVGGSAIGAGNPVPVTLEPTTAVTANQGTAGASPWLIIPSGNVPVVGPGAAGAALSGNPNVIAASDGANAQIPLVDAGAALYTNNKTTDWADDIAGAAPVDPYTLSTATTTGAGTLTVPLLAPSLSSAAVVGSNINAPGTWGVRCVDVLVDNNGTGQAITAAALNYTATIGSHTATYTATPLELVQPSTANNAVGRYTFGLPIGITPTSVSLVLTFAAAETASRTITAATFWRHTLPGVAITRFTALTVAANVKTSSGALFGLQFFNPGASTVFLQFFDALAVNVTLGTTTPLFTLPLYANGTWDEPVGKQSMLRFGTALSVAATTTFASAAATGTGVQGQVWYL